MQIMKKNKILKNILNFLSKDFFLLFCSIGIILSLFGTTLSLSSNNYENHFVNALYSSKYNPTDVFCEASIYNKSSNQDYYFNDYQFSEEDVEDIRDTFYAPSIFIFKSYGVNYQLNSDGEIVNSYSSTYVFPNNLDIAKNLTAVSVKLTDLTLQTTFIDFFGVDFFCRDISGLEASNGCIITYETAIDYCHYYLSIDNPTEEDIYSLLGKEIEPFDRVSNIAETITYNKVKAVIKGVLNPFGGMEKEPLINLFDNVIFISNDLRLRTSSQIYFQMPSKKYTAYNWIKEIMHTFNVSNGYSANQSNFALFLKYYDTSNNSLSEILNNSTDSFNKAATYNFYFYLFIVYFVIMLFSIAFFLVLIFKSKLKIYILNLDFLKIFLGLSFSFIVFFALSQLFRLFISFNVLFYPFGRFSSQFVLIAFFAIALVLIIPKIVAKKRESNCE